MLNMDRLLRYAIRIRSSAKGSATISVRWYGWPLLGLYVAGVWWRGFSVRHFILALLLLALPSSAQDLKCADLLDAGVPAPVVQLPAGAVLTEPSWVMTPARMCATGQRLANCEGTGPSPTPILIAAGGGLALGAVAAVLVIVLSGHLR